MYRLSRLSMVMIFIVVPAILAMAADAKLNEAAPEFTLVDSEGKKHSLSAYKGKYVVLEWVNYDCPFVKKHYGAGNMQKLQKTYRDKEVVWLSICSSAPSKQGHFEGKGLAARIKKEGAAHSAYLVDESGEVGKMYGAKTTPHMFIIDPKGKLIYAGGIDDQPSTKKKSLEGANNYVQAVLDAALAGKPVPVQSTSPYGCSVKYKK